MVWKWRLEAVQQHALADSFRNKLSQEQEQEMMTHWKDIEKTNQQDPVAHEIWFIGNI